MALGLYRAVGDRLGEANVLAAQSRLLIDSDPAQSTALLQAALELRAATNDAYSSGADLGNYGLALLGRGRATEAVTFLTRARDRFGSRGLAALVQQMQDAIDAAQGTLDSIERFAPLLAAIAAVARGEQAEQVKIEAQLATLAEQGWQLEAATQRIWQGERDAAALIAELDEQDSALVRRVLALIAAAEAA